MLFGCSVRGMLVTGVMLRLSALLGLADVPELKSNLETSGAGLSVWNPALIPGVLEKPVVVGKLVTVVGMLVMVVEMLVKVVGMRVTVVGKLVIVVGKPVTPQGVVEVARKGESRGQVDIGVAGNVRRDLQSRYFLFKVSSTFDCGCAEMLLGKMARGRAWGMGLYQILTVGRCALSIKNPNPTYRVFF